MLDTEAFGGLCDHRAEAVERAVRLALEVMGIERKPHHPAVLGDRAHHVVTLVAQGRLPAVQVGMGDGDRAFGPFGGFDGRAVGAVAHVHDHADAVHLADDLPPHARQAGVFGLVAARREKRLVVVGKLHEAHAKLVPDLDQPDIVLDGAGVLEAEEDGGAPGLARLVHVTGPLAVKDQVGILLEPAVPAFHVQHGFTKGLVIGDGDMHRVHPALAHLAEDLFRPVGILQCVDPIAHAGVPAEM